MADNRQMLDKWKDFRLSRYQQLDEEKIKMGFAGLKDEKERAAVILYLNQNSYNPKELP